MLLSACAKPTARPSEALFFVADWPEPIGIETQAGVAKYVTRGKMAYDSCKVNVYELREMYLGKK